MASQADLLRTLPPELRQCVYSHLFFGDGDGTVQIEHKPRSEHNPRSDDWLLAILALPEDFLYVANYWGKRANLKWPQEIDEAFFRAFDWMNVEQPWGREKVNGRSRNELVSELIYELTGQLKCRKSVSSHIQVLKCFLSGREDAIGRRDYWRRQAQAYGVTNSGSPVSDEYPTNLTQFPNCGSSDAPSIIEEPPLPHCNTTFTRTALSLSLVNHFYRTECIDYLASNTRFDFGLNRHTLPRFCSTAPVDLIVQMRHALITMVEGYMPRLPDWSDLRTLQIELWPRNPTRPEVRDREWGRQTERLLARLGVALAVRARITLEMRWAADCERFEREYVEKGRWKRIVGNDGHAVVGREEGFRRTVYELCGNWKTAVEVTETEVELASALRGFEL